MRARVKDLAWSAYVWPKGKLGNRVQGLLIGGIETKRVQVEWEHASRILLVHTPGKVGSKAMVAALNASCVSTDSVFHTHRINPDNLVDVGPERAALAPRRTWYTADFLGQALRRPNNKSVVVLSAVRDPIARSLSAFLQNLERYGASRRPITTGSAVDLADITHQFVEHLEGHAVTDWFALELNAMFGVDIFAAPFDHEAGYQALTRDRLSVGVIRHDRFDDALAPFIRAVAGLDAPRVGRINDSSAKGYGEVYAAMRASMRLPSQLVERTYDSVYVRHFFTDEERESAVTRWTVGSGHEAAASS